MKSDKNKKPNKPTKSDKPEAFLLSQSYGKSRVRLSQITRHADRHDLRELTAEVILHGDFSETYLTGDNSKVLPTDTVKNTVYALAAGHPITAIEDFGLRLARHFLDTLKHASAVEVRLDEQPLRRLTVAGKPHPTAFTPESPAEHFAELLVTRSRVDIQSGLTELLLIKTTDSAFRGFLRDKYTTLPETDDRIFATLLSARWTWVDPTGKPNWNAARGRVLTALLESFAGHKSLSVQQTMFAMGKAALAAAEEIDEIELELPNQHRIPVDLQPFGLENRNEIFVVTEEPHGQIRCTVGRDDEEADEE